MATAKHLPTDWLPDSHYDPLQIRIGASRQEMIDRFGEFVMNNPGLQLEQSAEGEVIVMLPTGGRSGIRNSEVTKQVANWAAGSGGQVFDSQTLFQFPNGARRGPDCSWVQQTRWDALSDVEQEAYPPLAPDLAIELRSKSDRVAALRAKMEEYVANGVRLGWLIDPYERTVCIYRPQQSVDILREPLVLDGEEVAVGLKLDLSKILN